MAKDSQPDQEVWERTARLAELGVMTSSLLHELRQPLYSIKTIAELALARPSDRNPERLRRLLEAVQHMEDLVVHYGGVVRADDPPCLFDMNGPVREAVDMLAHRARQVGATMRTHLFEQPVLVRARQSAVRQMSVNLLQNAFDAVEGVETRCVDIRTEVRAGRAILEVTDTGLGVPEEMRDCMFDAFVTTKAQDKGTGLGLFITRKLVNEAGGELRLLNAEVGDMRFEISLEHQDL